jgi:hypothetical protein
MSTLRWVLVGVLVPITLVAGINALPHAQPRYGCMSEAQVEVVLTHDYLDWHAGEHACVTYEDLSDSR